MPIEKDRDSWLMSRDKDSARERSDRGGSSLAGEFLLQGYVVAMHPIPADDIALLVDAVELAAGKAQREQLGTN